MCMCLPEVVKTNVAVSAKTSLGCGLLLNNLLNFYLKRMAGGMTVGFSNSVFLSERDSADRNNAIAYFMREQNCFPRYVHCVIIHKLRTIKHAFAKRVADLGFA